MQTSHHSYVWPLAVAHVLILICSNFLVGAHIFIRSSIWSCGPLFTVQRHSSLEEKTSTQSEVLHFSEPPGISDGDRTLCISTSGRLQHAPAVSPYRILHALHHFPPLRHFHIQSALPLSASRHSYEVHIPLHTEAQCHSRRYTGALHSSHHCRRTHRLPSWRQNHSLCMPDILHRLGSLSVRWLHVHLWTSV